MKSKTILIVEDEFLIAKDIGDLLMEEGYQVVNFIASYEEAIEHIEKKCPDLVITDINLKKDKSGIDIGHYLVQKDAIPFIYLTSYSDKVMMDRVHATRPHGFIVKPFKPANVTTVVSVVLNNYAHRKLDVMRTSNDIVDDIPFVLKRVIEHIELNLEKKILTGDLAKITKWKPQHFQRLFIRFLGVTPNQYILNRRIEKAKALLAETPLTITNISNDLGFKNPSTFYLKFKKSTNKTPDAYRKWAKAMKEYV